MCDTIINLQVFKARRVARMKMDEDGYDERAAAKKKQKKCRRDGAEGM